MNATIYPSNIYWNKKSFYSYFLTEQAGNTFDELAELADDLQTFLDCLDDATEGTSVDDFCDTLHSEQNDRIVEIYGLENCFTNYLNK